MNDCNLLLFTYDDQIIGYNKIRLLIFFNFINDFIALITSPMTIGFAGLPVEAQFISHDTKARLC